MAGLGYKEVRGYFQLLYQHHKIITGFSNISKGFQEKKNRQKGHAEKQEGRLENIIEVSRKFSEQPFSTGSGRITLKNCLREYFRLLKSPDFRL